MDFGLPFNSPRGVMYLPPEPPLEPEGRKSFPPTLKADYIAWVANEGKNRKLLTPLRRSNYRHYLRNPDAKSILADPKDRRREACEKFHCLKNFELQDSQIYRRAEIEDGKQLPPRYAACDYDASDIIERVHRNLLHASK
jgi:hypothetical protein